MIVVKKVILCKDFRLVIAGNDFSYEVLLLNNDFLGYKINKTRRKYFFSLV